MKRILILASFALAAFATAQTPPPPPPARPGVGGPPLSPGTRGRAAGSDSPSLVTETIRVLGQSAVQKALGLTLTQWSSLDSLARGLGGSAASEEQALSAVSRVLTSGQTAKLTGLMVTDLGYASLEFSAVRARLALTDDQSARIDDLLSTLNVARAALATGSTRASQQAIATLRAKTAASLAKVLTPEQDAKLRAMATQL